MSVGEAGPPCRALSLANIGEREQKERQGQRTGRVGGLAGTDAGTLIGHLRGGMSRDDVKEIGEMLDESEAALIVVEETTIERAIEEETRRAKSSMKKQAEATEMERAIDAM